MMTAFRDWPIQRKLALAILGTTGIALIAACATFIFYETAAFRTSLVSKMTALADVVAANSNFALNSEDEQETAELLSTLKADPEIVAGFLFTNDAKLLASYVRPGTARKIPSRPEDAGGRFEGDRLVLFRPVLLEDGTRVGTICLQATLTEANARLANYVSISLAVLAGALLLAVVLSTGLQRAISRPILALAGMAQRIGEKRDYSARAEKLGDDEIGMLTDGFNEMLEVIQERDNALRAANEELRTSHERFQIVARATNDAVWDWDLATNARWWNEGYESLFGYTPEETDPGIDSWIKFIHPDDVARVTHGIHKVIDDGRDAWWDEYRFRRKDREYAVIFDRGHVTRDANGKPLRMIGAMQDITERREAEEKIRQLNASLEERVRERTSQLEAAVKELDAFSYSVSHDLRAPLRAVDGFSRIVIAEYSERLDDNGRRMLGVLRSETQRMGRLIDDLLAFSRLGRQRIERAPIDMRALAQEVFDEMAATEPERKLQLDLHPIPPAHGAEAMIRQVWANLIGNAVKFTKEREIAVIEIGVRESGGGEIAYFVKDNGAGFDMRFAGKLFGVFQRLHSQQEFHGTGVGLALVQRIVQRHGGRIWADAEVGRGATFFFTLPNQHS